jgi:hypothetical protein
MEKWTGTITHAKTGRSVVIGGEWSQQGAIIVWSAGMFPDDGSAHRIHGTFPDAGSDDANEQVVIDAARDHVQRLQLSEKSGSEAVYSWDGEAEPVDRVSPPRGPSN